MGLETNKIVASVLLAGLIAMLSGTFAKIAYYPEEAEERGYQVEVAEDSSDKAEEEEEINIAAMILNASVDAGKKVARKCVACHSFEKGGANKVGPNLWNLLGDEFAHKDDFSYSKVFKELEGKWDYENLWAFLNNPKGWAPGTKMAFVGLRKPEDLANMIKYMRSLSDEPIALPEVKEEEPESENSEEAADETAESAKASPEGESNNKG